MAAEFRTEWAANGIPAERKGQGGFLLPPNAKVEHPVQAHLGEEELALVNEKASIDHILLNGVDDFVEGHNHRFKNWLVEFEGEIGRSLHPRHGDALARKLLWLQGLRGNDDGAVAFAETSAAIEEDVLVAERGVGGKADGSDVVSFSERGLVQRLDVR